MKQEKLVLAYVRSYVYARGWLRYIEKRYREEEDQPARHAAISRILLYVRI